MKTLSNFFITNGKFTFIITAFFVVAGILGLRKMNSESFPSVNFAMATITTNYDGASAQEIETKITRPIEDEIRGVSGLRDVRSVSQPGLSNIYVRADIDNIDVVQVMADLQRAVDRVSDLPGDLREQPKFLEIKSEEFPVYEIAIFGDNAGRVRDLAANALKEDLEDNPLVKNVRLTGYSERAFQIFVDVKKLRQYHIGINEVLNTIQARNVNVPGGPLREVKNQILIRLEGKIQSSTEIGNIPIRSNFQGQRVLIKDVAQVLDSEEEKKVLVRLNGEEATFLIVTKKGGADTIKLVKGIVPVLERYQKQYQDKLTLRVYNNEAIKVQRKLDVLNSNALQGMALVLLFLLIFLPGKVGIMSSLSLPVAVMATFGMMPLFGMNINSVTVLGLVIAIGMLVDNAIVISDNFSRLRSEGLSAEQAALDSIHQFWIPITGTALTTIAAFLPMLVTKGIMGQFIKFIPIIVSLSLVISLLESFLLLPSRLVFIGRRMHFKTNTEEWFTKYRLGFERFIGWSLDHRYKVALLCTLLIFISLFLMVKVNKFILFPAEQTEMYIARFETPIGTRLSETDRLVKTLSFKIQETLQGKFDRVTSHAGVAKTHATDPKAKDGNNVGLVIIYVNEDTQNNVAHTEILSMLREIKIPEFQDLSFEAMVHGPPVGNDIEATFRANTEGEVNQMINAVSDDLKKIPGILDLKTDDVRGDDEVFIHLNYDKADRLGLNINQIGQTVRTAVSGKNLSTVTLNNKDVELVLRTQEKDRRNLEDLSKIEILDQRQNLIPLKEVATFEQKQGDTYIKRFNYKRAKTLLGVVDENKITAQEANQILLASYNGKQELLPGVSMVFGGSAESTKESMTSLFDALILSLIGIFGLLVLLFGSFIYPFVIMSTIPLGLIGFSISFALHHRPTSFMALIGIIGLGGVIVNSGIVLLSFIQELRKSSSETHLREILIKASGLRLRPVLATSLTTISGLFPTAYGLGGKDAMLIPMTLAMAWGLTSGTILTLIWVPIFVDILEDVKKIRWAALFRKGRKNE